MAVLSRLVRSVGPRAATLGLAVKQQVRSSSGSHWDSHMRLVVSRWSWTRFKDNLHFYVVTVSMPLLLCVAYMNLFIGPSKLVPIPEGYEPKEWEYERSPVTRWLVKNVYLSEQELHERKLHQVWECEKKSLQKALTSEVKRQMKVQGDYAAWYYMPTQAKYARILKNEREFELEHKANF